MFPLLQKKFIDIIISSHKKAYHSLGICVKCLYGSEYIHQSEILMHWFSTIEYFIFHQNTTRIQKKVQHPCYNKDCL